jgi:hypothetical protein
VWCFAHLWEAGILCWKKRIKGYTTDNIRRLETKILTKLFGSKIAPLIFWTRKTPFHKEFAPKQWPKLRQYLIKRIITEPKLLISSLSDLNIFPSTLLSDTFNSDSFIKAAKRPCSHRYVTQRGKLPYVWCVRMYLHTYKYTFMITIMCVHVCIYSRGTTKRFASSMQLTQVACKKIIFW